MNSPDTNFFASSFGSSGFILKKCQLFVYPEKVPIIHLSWFILKTPVIHLSRLILKRYQWFIYPDLPPKRFQSFIYPNISWKSASYSFIVIYLYKVPVIHLSWFIQKKYQYFIILKKCQSFICPDLSRKVVKQLFSSTFS